MPSVSPQPNPAPPQVAPATPSEAALDVRTPEERQAAHRLELLARVKTLRENTNMRRGSITNPKQNKIYVWVNINDNRQIEFQGMGYSLCKDPDIKTRWRTASGTHQRGDLLLYEIDKDLHEAIQVDNELRALEGIEAPKDAFQQTVQRHGGVPYEPALKH